MRLSSHRHSNGERGIALILALLVLALLVALILDFDAEARRELKEAAVFRDGLRAAALSRAAAQAVRAALKEDFTRKKALGISADTLTDLWATPLVNYPIGDGALTGKIEDERGKFNLNMLSGTGNEEAHKALLARARRLFEATQVDPLLVDALADWVDADDKPEPQGAESLYYQGLTPPYRCANGALESLGELRLVKGFTEDVLRRLQPYVTIHPADAGAGGGWVNLNTADPVVISTLDPQITMDLARSVALARPFLTAQDADAVAGFEPIAKTLRLAGSYRVNTDMVSVTGTLTVNYASKQVRFVLKRSPETGDSELLSFWTD
jgi:general secretion pathway protein K